MWRYVHVQGQTFGPADDERLILWVRERRLGPFDHVWIEEEGRWVAVRDVPDLAAELARLPPAPSEGRLAEVGSVAPEAAPRATPIPENLFAHEGARRYVRFETHLQGRYSVRRGNRPLRDEDFRPCSITNLSVSGAGVETPEAIAPGSTLRLRIDLPDADPEPFATNVHVSRTAPGVRPGTTEYGVRFDALPDDLKRRLIDFLEGLIAGGQPGA